MADKEDQPEAFSGELALALARKGKKAWNAWAMKSEGRKVDFSGVNFTTEENKDIFFEGFTFPGDVDFSGATFLEARFILAIFRGRAEFKRAVFKGDTDFQRAVFKEDTGFQRATFDGDAEFLGVTFEMHAGFGGAIFDKDASFLGVTFASSVSLERSVFRSVPDFRRSEFRKHVTLYSMDVEFKRPPEASHADKYRRLKELAVAARDHDREQQFFARELRAKRGFETRGLALVPSYFYELTSDFGRSLWRPSFGLLAVWFAFGNHYRWLASKNMDHLSDGLMFSTAQLFPFLGASKGVLAEAKVTLFGTEAVGNWVNTISVIEGFLGIGFLFLIGLALRNRFRI